MGSDAAKQRIHAEVRRRAAELIGVSHEIHANPETCFQERRAHDLLCRTLEEAGFEVEGHAFGLETAFAARMGSEGPLVAFICEYDALPGIGHACGHNVIAAAGLGAGLAAAAVAEELGGRIVVLGSPAEEGGGGKVFMARAGAFDGVDAALMVHPADSDLTRMNAIAIQSLDVRYTGQEAHAAAHPQKGRNALDAAVLGYMNVAALRQHIAPDERVHGIFVEAGAQPNIVPAHTSAVWYARAGSLTGLEPLKQRVMSCLEAGAIAAGCTMEHEWRDPPYAEMLDNHPLLAAFGANAASLGRSLREPSPETAVMGSTDMGNISHLVPSIHPMVATAPPGVAIHTPEFAAHACSDLADQAVLDSATALAATAADLWSSPDLLSASRSAHAEATAGGRPPVI